MLALAQLTPGTEILVLSDEVYEHLVFDGLRHESVLRYPELRGRSLAVSCFGKTFHNTGWKIGYCVARGLDRRVQESTPIQCFRSIPDAVCVPLISLPILLNTLCLFINKNASFSGGWVSRLRPLVPTVLISNCSD